jgi:hypothetical protein
MKYLKNPMTYVVGLTLIVIWLTFQYSKVNEENKVIKRDLERMTEQKDSIYSELFNESVISGRYELTFDHLKEIDKESYDKCERYLEHETE